MDILAAIKIFRRVTETKSFSRVAKELKVTQPTISKTIQSLEKELDLTLFRRSTRGLSLTVEGQRLYNSGGHLIDHYDRILSELHGQKLDLKGSLRIGVSLAFARLILSPILVEFGKIHPNLRMQFVLNDGFSDLIENNIDVAIRLDELSDSSLKAIKIGSFQRALYASNGYLKKAGTPKNISDLSQHRLLFYSRLQEGPQWILSEKGGGKTQFSFDPYIQTDGSDLMREAVLEGVGIAMLPTWMMIEPERKKEVVRLFLDASKSSIPIYAVTAPSRDLTAKQRAWIEFLRSKCEKNEILTIRR